MSFHKETCVLFSSGKLCSFGEKCRYSHVRQVDTSGTSPAITRDNKPKRRTPLLNVKEQVSDLNNPQLQSVPKSKKHQTRIYSKPLCRFYLKGHCYQGGRCNFTHSQESRSPRSVVEITEKHDTEQQSSICPYYRRGYCRLKTNCKWSHGLPVLTDDCVLQPLPVESTSISKHEFSFRKARNSNGVLLFPISELNENSCKDLAEKEIKYLKQKFPKASQNMGGDVKFLFQSSDPDWPYDIKVVNINIKYPAGYPMQVARVSLENNDQLPYTLHRYVHKSIEEWLHGRFKENEENGKYELVTRAFIRWLDRSLEEMFTKGLIGYQKELLAKAAGVELVSAAELRDQFAKKGAVDSEQSDDSNCSSASSQWETEDDSDDPDDDLLCANLNHSVSLEAAKKGVEVKLLNVQMRESVSSVLAERVVLIVQCSRCKFKTEFGTNSSQINVFRCGKCNQEALVTFRANLAHQFNSVIGYVDMEECSMHDVVLANCTFKLGCLACSRQVSFGGIIAGQMKDYWCHGCHSKLGVTAEGVKFFFLQPSSIDATGVIHVTTSQLKKVAKDPSIRVGLALPEEGVCRHYKKSFRWFRFPCCGKAYACDLCHDNVESHDHERANRMICGFCCKEQPFAADRPCISCSSSLTKASSSHWEGGKGCRDKIKMSRNDQAKYKNVTKIASKKTQAKKNVAKRTKLRHS